MSPRQAKPSENSEASILKEGLHPRNKHRGSYDFPALIKAFAPLAPFVGLNAYGTTSINYADPRAVKALNQALLSLHYGLRHWDLPSGALCPPVPGRVDYLHHLAELISEPAKAPTKGPSVRILDIGTGASCIYPLLGAREYDWSFVGTDIDAQSLQWARGLVNLSGLPPTQIELRHQKSTTAIFRGVTYVDERFAACLCNPPFHDSRAEADAGTLRKLRNLSGQKVSQRTLNFGGQDNELWCEGGEIAFITRMIQESSALPWLCRWFTTLVAKSLHLPPLQRALERARPLESRIIELRQGQKIGRIIAWRFQ